MSKLYFAKYFPVEGEDKYKGMPCEDGARCFAHRSHPCDRCGRLAGKRVKLFLCSRDIQVGDNIINPKWKGKKLKEGIDIVANEEDKNYLKEVGCYKVIGEISPHATYVKEGDEFNDEDISYYLDGIYRKYPVDKGTFEHSPSSYIIRIKGPCGYFH